MADNVFNDITLHKPLPIVKAKLWIDAGAGVETWTLENLMSESNITPETITRPDGYGGMRHIGTKIKITLYYNRFDINIHAPIAYYGAINNRFPMQVFLGNSGRVEGEGDLILSFTREPDILTFHYNWGSANKFMKYKFVFIGLIKNNALFIGDKQPL